MCSIHNARIPFRPVSNNSIVRPNAGCPGHFATDELVDRIFPVMRARGGFIPTCDHGVPEEVKYEDYLYFRKRCREFA